MAALTADWVRAQIGDVPPRRSIILNVKANTKIFAGSLVAALVASGKAVPSPGNNTARTIGVAGTGVDNTGGADNDQRVVCLRGNFLFRNGGAVPVAEANIGAVCNVLDDQTVTMDATNQTAGKVTGFKGDLVEVEIL